MSIFGVIFVLLFGLGWANVSEPHAAQAQSAATPFVGSEWVPENWYNYCSLVSATIPTAGNASPYPINITVSGMSGSIFDVNVQLKGLTHGYPSDIDILLVGPNGKSIILSQIFI